jgi:hypothetical protein
VGGGWPLPYRCSSEIKQSVLTPALNQVFKGEREPADAMASIKQPLQAMLQPIP